MGHQEHIRVGGFGVIVTKGLLEVLTVIGIVHIDMVEGGVPGSVLFLHITYLQCIDCILEQTAHVGAGVGPVVEEVEPEGEGGVGAVEDFIIVEALDLVADLSSVLVMGVEGRGSGQK